MSYLNRVIASIDDVPLLVINELNSLKELDKVTHAETTQLAKDEAKLLDAVRAAGKQGPDFDEEIFKEEAASLVKRRAAVQALLDQQSKLAQTIYEKFDHKIYQFDESTKDVVHLLHASTENGAGSGDGKKRKKRKHDSNRELEDAFEAEIAALPVDPTEPLYCTCRRVSYGQMVACENPDCEIEWFHFFCVGLKTEPKDAWYCPKCAPSTG